MDPISKFLNEVSIPKDHRLKSEVYIIEDKNIFAAKHISSGTYTIPGGAIEKGESVIQAAKRECIEEVGVLVKDLVLLDSKPYCFPFDNRVVVSEYSGMCVYSLVGGVDKIMNKGIEKHLKLEIVTIEEMIGFCRRQMMSTKSQWVKLMMNYRIKILKEILDGSYI